ncbi:MAG: hypothetical protein A2452_07810 [Candidatus Firestonebacteria bacterium RIFOXYC2_FULL_39_67]|nr:MAG: hypothetical protein A2536_01830 [Candidatus Firestonebacteria bacterium RIFOXYD2_FULL_39_29]OGF53972.1 MAG: hypothetical protein A2452_07810 [Candidatus Firestonebacteria bacterium RIFOXYC2_FULL_39_67]OGF56554.1 MAG: hypothetical protein A2497_06625 [Candidatus Firestonebacteria bacterium RifOxyC12_full_39_7]
MDKEKLKTIGIFALIFFVTLYLTMAYVIRGKSVIVPDIKGFPVEEARKILVSKGLALKERAESFSESIPDGCVMVQDPIEGSYIKAGRTVDVTVSRGLKMVTVPDIREQNARQSKILLSQSGLNIGIISKITTKDTPEGYIIAQNPMANSSIKRNAAVNVLASSGEKEIYYVMPNLMGKKYETVRKSLYSVKLNVGNVSYKTVSGFEKGSIVNQYPLPGSRVKKNSSVDLTVNYAENEKQYRLISVLYTVERGGLSVKRVRLVILDNDGSREIYNDMSRSGSTIEKSVRVSGSVILQVFINNEMKEERPYE